MMLLLVLDSRQETTRTGEVALHLQLGWQVASYIAYRDMIAPEGAETILQARISGH